VRGLIQVVENQRGLNEASEPPLPTKIPPPQKKKHTFWHLLASNRPPPPPIPAPIGADPKIEGKGKERAVLGASPNGKWIEDDGSC
jgi:hypothetical protein